MSVGIILRAVPLSLLAATGFVGVFFGNSPGEVAGTPSASAPFAASAAVPADRVTAGLPVIRLTPRDVMLGGTLHRGKVDLAGEWDFTINVPPAFDGTAKSIDGWQKVRVPGHFSWQGFPEMHKAFNMPVAWRRTFQTPESWKGQNLRVRLRFESADGLCRVYVNGKAVGTSERVNTPSEFDITDALRDGANDLGVTVETTLSGYWSKRTMRGLARAVYLQAVPAVSIARLHVASELKRVPTDANDAVPAVALASVRVANDTDHPTTGLSARFTLTDSGSQRVPLKLRNADLPLPPVEPGNMLELTLPLPVDAIRPWDAEHPNLYRLRMDLVDNAGTVVMTAQQRFGFRQIETRGGQLLLKGRPIKFRGANYHMTYPGEGYFLSPDRVWHDLDLFRNMNLNVLRSRPVPMTEYLDARDKIGLYTTVEGMFTLMMYDRGPQKDNGADPSITPQLREHLAAMLESTRSNPRGRHGRR